MAMLDRYRKKGGFVQLLSLIEGFGPQKQEKFLSMIEAEDAIWAEAIKGKLLSIRRILGWEEQSLALVMQRLPTKTLAVVLKGLTPEDNQKILKFFSHAEKRKIEDEQTAFANPSEAEVSSAMVKIIELTRSLIKDGELRAEKFDSNLLVDEDIEESLASASASFKAPGPDEVFELESMRKKPSAVAEGPKAKASTVTPASQAGATHEAPVLSKDIQTLQMKLISLDKENKALKQELKIIRERLEQIKKIAA